MVVSERRSAEQRREEILEAALLEFADHGLGASTEEIAKRAGISQPYVFRLFGTKRELLKAVVARCFRQTLEGFQRAAEGKRGEEALLAMGEAYSALLHDRTRLRSQMQAYAACDDPEMRDVVRAGFGDIATYVERVSGADPETVSRWFAKGMLLNVIASMDLLDHQEPWAERLVTGCMEEDA
jgi:AcrR family transcriptional regulator